MGTYNLDFYTVDPLDVGFTNKIGTTFTYTGPGTTGGSMVVTDPQSGSGGLVLDDNVGNDPEQATANVTFGSTSLTARPVSADLVWTLYDPVLDTTFEVVRLTIIPKTGPTYQFTLSEHPLVAGRDYTILAYDNQPNNSDGDPVFTYSDYVCFTAGTRIRVPGGWRAAEDLVPGDMVETRDAGPQPLRWKGRARVVAAGGNAPVRIAPGVFGNTRALTVSPLHRVLVCGWAAELVAGTPQVLIAAKFLNGLPGVERAESGIADYVHLLFDRHHLLDAEGGWAESFHPGAEGERRLSVAERAEICALFPALRDGFAGYGPSARPSLKAHEARFVVALLAGGAEAGRTALSEVVRQESP